MAHKTKASFAPLALPLTLIGGTLCVFAAVGVPLAGPLTAVAMAAAITIPMAFAFAHGE
jgi:hypothetical protein